MRRGEIVQPSRLTLAEYGEEWLAAQTRLRERTVEKYEGALRLHIGPHLGRLRLSEITPDHIVALIGKMEHRGYSAWSIRGALTPLSRILGNAARKGVINSNPMLRLEVGERPTVQPREPRDHVGGD